MSHLHLAPKPAHRDPDGPETDTSVAHPISMTGSGSPDSLTDSAVLRSAPTLVLLGVNHHSAPLQLREQLAIPGSRLAEATRALVARPGVREALILSTCNRVELLAAVDSSASDQPQELARFLEAFCSIPLARLSPHLYTLRERDAVLHLFRVASSLDSLVVGEAQILGQVKESWSVARELGAVRQTLDPLLQRAFSVAKRVRSETRIGSSAVSVASVAVELARKIFGTLAGKHVLIVGAGKMSELAARHLIQHGISTILISNRTEERAQQLARDLDTSLPTQVIPFEQLHQLAHRADIVLTSTGAAAGPGGKRLFDAADGRRFLERRRNRPMFFIDIAVPRDVDPALNKVDGCFVYDIDDLQQLASDSLASRSREATAAEEIVTAEVERYHEHLHALDAVPVIRELQERNEALRQSELARSASRLAGLSPAQLQAVEALTRSLVGKLAHAPITAIRSAATEGNSRLLEELTAIFTAPRQRESPPAPAPKPRP